MPTDVIMPQMGESIFEGTITKWLKKTGDRVEKDEPLFEISTDKVDAEIPSPAAGILSEIKALEGATVQINAVVAVIGDAGAPATQELESQAGAAKPQGPVSVVMPQMGESIFEGTIIKWLKKTGDRVEKDEPLFEISTDKVDAEIPSPAAGILTEIMAPEGATVDINTVVAVIGGSASAAQLPAASEVHAPSQAALHLPTKNPHAEPAAGTPRRSSPLVRRMAKEHNIDLARVSGTGSEGRITKEDILRYLSRETSTKTPAAPQVPLQAQSAPPPGLHVPSLAGQVLPMSRMRAIIGQRMIESLAISPHAHTVYRIDMTRIARLRERERAGFEQRNGVRLTYMPFIAAAAIRALEALPYRQLVSRRRGHPLSRQHPSRHRRSARGRPDRAGYPRGPAAQLRRSGPRHQRPRTPRPHQEAQPRRGNRFHLHPHQLRRLRRRVRHAHHQPAGVGHPGHRRPAQGARSPDRRRRQRHHCDPFHAVLLPGLRPPHHRRRRLRQIHAGLQERAGELESGDWLSGVKQRDFRENVSLSGV